MVEKRFRLVLMLTIIGAVFTSACGTVATPEWAADVQFTRVAAADTAVYLTSIAPTATFTLTPAPTATPIPPTITNTPTAAPTETSVPTETPMPATAESTEAIVAAPDAVSDSAAAIASADPAAGAVAFVVQRTMPEGAVWACNTCHSITPNEQRVIGPGLWNLAVRAETRVEGQSAIDYIYTSIVAPNDYIVPPDASGAPYPPNLMPAHYGNPQILVEQDLNNMIAYLLTLQ